MTTSFAIDQQPAWSKGILSNFIFATILRTHGAAPHEFVFQLQMLLRVHKKIRRNKGFFVIDHAIDHVLMSHRPHLCNVYYHFFAVWASGWLYWLLSAMPIPSQPVCTNHYIANEKRSFKTPPFSYVCLST